jgi:poly(rC)-binding protein 3/4
MASRATPSKRPFQKSSSDNSGRGKWKKTKNASSQHSQQKIQPGVPVFRILCPASKSGNVIGKGGSIIAKIRQETGAKITVEEAAYGCDERVILIKAIEKDKETNHHQNRPNNEGVVLSAGGDHGKDNDSSKEENDDSEKEHIKKGKNDSEKNHSKEENDDSLKDYTKEENDDSEKDNNKEEMDDSDKHNSKEDNNDLEKDNMKQESGDLVKDRHSERHDDSERDYSKEEKDGPLVAKDMEPESESEMPPVLKAVLLVFDRIFGTEDENETGDASDVRSPVSMRLLVLYSQAGCLLGKNGSVIKKMSSDNGCEIRLTKDKLPPCALSQDKLCQVHYLNR